MMNEVKEGENYITDFAYGGSDAKHMWAEPKEDQASALYLDANFEKAFKIDDISSVFHYELVAENGGLNTYLPEGKDEIRCSGFDEIVHEDDIMNLPLAVSISRASEDHYLDVDFAKKVPDLDCKFCDELSVGSLRSEVHSPGTSNEEVGVSDTSIPAPQCFSAGKLTDEMHGDYGNKCRYQRSVEDKMSLEFSLTCDIQDFQETNDVQNTLENGSSFSHEKKTHFSLTSIMSPYSFAISTLDEIGPVSQCKELEDFCTDDLSTDSCAETKTVRARQRRLCRPPQRYLDGLPSLKSNHHPTKKHPTSLSKEKDLGVRSQKKHHRKALGVKASKAQESNSELDTDVEYEPCYNIRKSKRSDRRKNSKPWTLDEVVALVDGISKFGTGQWTAVKRTFFSCSIRTATDVRDKWRNLVKTNCKNSMARKDDQLLRNGTQPLPKPVMERVRELANAPVLKCRSKSDQKISSSQGHDISPSLSQ